MRNQAAQDDAGAKEADDYAGDEVEDTLEVATGNYRDEELTGDRDEVEDDG